MAKKSLTKLQKDYLKEVKRINKTIRNYIKQGYKNVAKELSEDIKNASQKRLEKYKERRGANLRKFALKRATYSGKETGGKEVQAKRVPQYRKEYNKSSKPQSPTPETEYIPDMSNITALIDRIQELPDNKELIALFSQRKRKIEVDFSGYKERVLSILSGIINTSNDEQIESFNKYLQTVSSEIDKELDVINNGTYKEQVEEAYGKLLATIVNRPLTLEEAQDMDFESFADEELDDIPSASIL